MRYTAQAASYIRADLRAMEANEGSRKYSFQRTNTNEVISKFLESKYHERIWDIWECIWTCLDLKLEINTWDDIYTITYTCKLLFLYPLWTSILLLISNYDHIQFGFFSIGRTDIAIQIILERISPIILIANYLIIKDLFLNFFTALSLFMDSNFLIWMTQPCITCLKSTIDMNKAI